MIPQHLPRLFGRLAALWLVLSLAACGGGGKTPTPPPPPSTYSVNVTVGAGTTATPVTQQVQSGKTASITVGLLAGYSNLVVTGGGGTLSGSTYTTGPITSNTTITASSTASVTGAPLVFYTDTLSGPTSGGEGGKGGYLSIFGKNFGSASGLGTTTKVFIGTSEVANYRYLGAARVGAKLGVQQLTVQVGSLGGAAAGTALPVKVVVGGASSNANNGFTPTSGKVLFVSLTGNDSTAVPGDIAKPWRYLQNQNAHTGAYFAMDAGDQVVIRGGEWSDALGVDTTWMRASWHADARNGTAAAWIHITAYPGPIMGNAIEDVHYTTPAGKSGGIAGPWSAITGTSGEYWSVSNLRMEMNAAAASDAAPINLQYTGGHWRVVNNELGPWPVAGVTSARAGGIAGYGEDVKIFGNHIHHIAGTVDLENHGIYVEGATTAWEIAYNWIHDITGGSLIQFNDVGALAGTYVMPHGGVWVGFTGMRVHHNWLEDAAKYGLNVNDSGSVNGQLELRAWNNVIIGTALPPVRTNSTATTIDYTFAYNTIYNAMKTNSGSGNGYFRNEDQGVGNIRIYNNLLAIGPQTVTGTEWFYHDYTLDVSGWSFKNNLYWDASRGLTVPAMDGAKVVGDPKFTNAALGDLSLQATSPAVDKALQATPFTITDDLSGLVTRPSGVANDIGAFERAQ